MTNSRIWPLVMLALTGCLPRGAPPAGRQIFADRRMSLAALVPSDGDGLLRILVTQPGNAPDSKDLYVVALDPTGTPTSPMLLISNYDDTTGLGCNFGVAPCSSVGPRTVFAYTKDNVPTRVDPVTGQQLDTSSTSFQSPSGQRTFVSDQGFGTATTSGTLYEADGTATVLGDVQAPTFTADDDFLYETSAGDLLQIPPGGTPSTLATGLVSSNGAVFGPPGFRVIASPDGTLLILTRMTADGEQFSVRDPLTGQERLLPTDGVPYFGNLSPDGQWLVGSSDDLQGTFTFFNVHDGTTYSVSLLTIVDGTAWRPGHNELWVSAEALSATTWILTPGAAPIVVPGLNLNGGFTADGAYWLSSPDFNTSENSTYVGPADDPTGPALQLNPFSSNANPVWMLPNDRVLGAVYYKMEDYEERTDAVMVDPQAGRVVTLGERGRIAAVGLTRVMGMFHFDEERGDLTVSEFDTAQQTILAPEFATTAFADQQGADQLAPGARIVYQFQARTASPYDGIWIANCP